VPRGEPLSPGREINGTVETNDTIGTGKPPARCGAVENNGAVGPNDNVETNGTVGTGRPPARSGRGETLTLPLVTAVL
jgi:hypothetical protein